MWAYVISLVVFLAAVGVPSSESMEPCPLACRCTAPPSPSDRHRWHHLLASYRSRRLVYGNQKIVATKRVVDDDDDEDDDESQDGRQMTCLGLRNMPDYVPTDVSKVTLYGDTRGDSRQQQDSPAGGGPSRYGGVSEMPKSYHQLTAIRKYTFRRSKSLSEMVIEGNRIKVIHANDFDMMTNLRKLSLRSNRLKLVWPKAFSGLDKLVELDLSDNHLKNLPKKMFDDTVLLERIILSKNNLRRLHRKAFSKLTHLEYLDISNNHLKDIPKDTFVRNPVLHEIIADNNHLSVIRPEWFSGRNQVTKLSFRGNRIHQLLIDNFVPLASLKYLYLDHNSLTHLRDHTLTNTRALHTLTLSHNNISYIDEGVFHDTPELLHLDLSANTVKYLTDSTFKGLSRLQTLSLSNNNIFDISAQVFQPISKMTHLDLSHNFIKTVRRRNFFGLLDLRELKMDHNDLRVIEDEGFAVSEVNTYSKMTWVYLHYNKLTELRARSLYGLAYVKFLNLCHNQIYYVHEGALSMLGRLHTLIINNNAISTLEAGLFKSQGHLHHVNMAANELREIHYNTFQGLRRVEDINLEDNKIEQVAPSAFTETPVLTSVNMKRNKLRTLDMTFLDEVTRLKYLDLSRNAISRIRLPDEKRQQLYFLSLADNLLETMKEDAVGLMAERSSISLYGNPWRCDCKLRWMVDERWRADIKIPDEDDIVCKTPELYSGQQVFKLRPENMRCEEEERERGREHHTDRRRGREREEEERGRPAHVTYSHVDTDNSREHQSRDSNEVSHSVQCEFVRQVMQQNRRRRIKPIVRDRYWELCMNGPKTEPRQTPRLVHPLQTLSANDLAELKQRSSIQIPKLSSLESSPSSRVRAPQDPAHHQQENYASSAHIAQPPDRMPHRTSNTNQMPPSTSNRVTSSETVDPAWYPDDKSHRHNSVSPRESYVNAPYRSYADSATYSADGASLKTPKVFFRVVKPDVEPIRVPRRLPV